jgi:hypothetical protein
MGARVVPVADQGYGSALMGGIAAARGRYVLIGDADDSYDFGEIPRFVRKLREGFDLVQGCRFPSGGGYVVAGAMPRLHRYCGNPAFSLLARIWFRAPIHDVYCGMRAFTRELYDRLDQHCTGMEFAVEMIVKATFRGARITEVPITLHRSGRKNRGSHLRTFHDGWRTLHFLLISSPQWVFLIPGAALALLGTIGYMAALPGVTLRGVTFDAHTLLFASLAILCGYQAVLFSIFATTFAVAENLLPETPICRRIARLFTFERALVCGAAGLVIGACLLAVAVREWQLTGFGRLDYSRTMRWVIPGATLVALGLQTVLAGVLVSILGMKRK